MPLELPVRPPEECTILVVDDDKHIVDFFVAALSLTGYKTLTAMEGYTAIKLIETHQPDLIILDVRIPGLDGIQVCERVKKKPGFNPVILVTGYMERSRKIDGLEAGADDFINKPVEAPEITARVRSLMRTKQLYDHMEHLVEQRTEELRAAYDRVKALDRVKANVLALVSHELRTPLVQATTALDLLFNDGLSAEKRTEMRSTITEAMERLKSKIDDIGVFSDPTNLTPAATSVRDLVTGAAGRVRNMQRTEDPKIELNVSRGLPAVMVDAQAMIRALTHIIDNAVKFSDGMPVHVRAGLSDDGVHLAIRDEGPGIEANYLPALYELFDQAEDKDTRHHGGLGIGMAMVKVILDGHDIPMKVKTQKGKGTTITLVLPLASTSEKVPN